MIRFIKWLVKVIKEFLERRRKMDYFITLNDKSIDAIGEAVEKPITVIEGLKEDIAERDETIAELNETIDEKDEVIAGKDEEIAELETSLKQYFFVELHLEIRNNRDYPIGFSRVNKAGGVFTTMQSQGVVIQPNSNGTIVVPGVFNFNENTARFGDFIFINMTTGNANVYGFSSITITSTYQPYATVRNGDRIDLNVPNLLEAGNIHAIYGNATFD